MSQAREVLPSRAFRPLLDSKLARLEASVVGKQNRLQGPADALIMSGMQPVLGARGERSEAWDCVEAGRLW